MSESETTQNVGFQMSRRRALGEIAVLLIGIGGALALVIWVVRHLADLAVDHVPIEVDRTFGEQVSNALSAGASRCTDPAALAYVERIAAPLVKQLSDRRFSFQFSVADSKEINAFALPGGFVTVNFGLLEFAESGEEVAAVLAHELQHVVRRHSMRRLLRDLGSSAVLSALFGGTDLIVPASVVQDFTTTAYGRDDEREADARGLEVLVKAGIDPRGMGRFFERLSKKGPTLPALLSTHPDPGDRARAAAKAAQAAHATVALPSPKGLRCR